MNKHNILEHAAKACGVATFDYGGIHFSANWNPLTSSADCAAMCAKLKIDTLWTDDYVICGDDSRTYESEVDFVDHNNDREAAWRYAATTVAAKIGGMK